MAKAPNMRDYTELDAAILRALSECRMGFTALMDRVEPESKRLADEQFENAPAWRIVDRRLQALRRAGKIKYLRAPEGWAIVDMLIANKLEGDLQ